MLQFVSRENSLVVSKCACGRTHEVSIPPGENPTKFLSCFVVCTCGAEHKMTKVLSDDAFSSAGHHNKPEQKIEGMVYEFGGTSVYGFAGIQQVVIDGRKITIIKGGLANAISLQSGEKSFDLAQVSTIQVKENGFMPGYLQFGILGSPDLARGTIGALGSDNAVIIYSRQQYESALEIKKHIESHQERYRLASTSV
ncbi:MAG: hypothetical protein Q8S19_02070, partial [Bacillota bacterium]|nr:hypothetical protein [Bacillota bacterium]